jgi:hypothetical protein
MVVGEETIDDDPLEDEVDCNAQVALIDPTIPLASLLAATGSTRGKSTSFHVFLSLLLSSRTGGGRFSPSSSSSSPKVFSPDPLSPAPAPGRCSTNPARAKWAWRSLMEPRSWTDSRLAAERAIWRCFGLRRAEALDWGSDDSSIALLLMLETLQRCDTLRDR